MPGYIAAMKVKDADILFVPGNPGLQQAHWQVRWQGRLSTGRILEMEAADAADASRWAKKVAGAVNEAQRPVVLVAHGQGVTAAVHAASNLTAHVAGAFLVAPADPERLSSVAAYPEGPLPFPSLLIASRDDPNCSFSRAEEFAADWGSLFIDAGNVGRIDADSGHGPWPEGSMTFARFVSRLPAG